MAAGLERWACWEKIRGGGRSRFIWVRGVCALGLTTGIVLTAIIGRGHPTPSQVGLGLLISAAGGYLWGFLVWQRTESLYLADRQAAVEQAQTRQLLESLSREVRELREALRERQRRADS
jgi:hypothetical protein